MVKNYFKAAFRNFTKNTSYTLLNVLGLALGLAASILILQFVKYENSYDTFHSNLDRIYRIQYNIVQNGITTVECAAAVPAVGPEMKDNFAEVIEFTRLFPLSGIISFHHPENGFTSFREEDMQFTDPAVFKVFDFNLLEGNEERALDGPNKVVISQRIAEKYFQRQDVIGEHIKWAGWNGNTDFEITGVMENVPDNSHIKFDILFSQETLNNMTDNSSETAWGWYDFNTYVLLQERTDPEAFQTIWDEHLTEVHSERWTDEAYAEFLLQPVKDIHLYSNLLQESQPEEQGDGDSVYFLSIIAFFILLIAWVNYINMSTAKSFERANEVGVRKVMGAEKQQLIGQFMAESFIINLLAVFIALVLVALSWDWFASLSGRSIPMTYMLQPDFWLLITGLFLVGTLLSGFYPALVLSSFKPVAVLKGKSSSNKGGSILRKGLVIFQFVSSVFLICATAVVYQQLKYMQNKDLGIDITETLVLEGPGIVVDSLYDGNLMAFRNEIMSMTGVKSFSASSNVPGDEIFWTRGIRRLQGGPENSLTIYNIGIDHDYVNTFGLNIVAGRNFNRDFTNDNERVLLNRELAESLQFEDIEEAIGQQVRLGGDTLEIAGVLENFHQMSLKDKVRPLAFRLTPQSSFYAIKIEPGKASDVLAAVRDPWNTIFPGNPLDYFYLDSFFNRQYEKDRQFGQVFALFAGLSIIVACLGLFGLASFMTIQRTKEIGIRKVMGSDVARIIILLSKGFTQLVIVANLIAWPLAWFIMNQWLETFPYHTSINPILFVGTGLLVVLIAFLSVGLQTFKAARLNPAKTLKHE